MNRNFNLQRPGLLLGAQAETWRIYQAAKERLKNARALYREWMQPPLTSAEKVKYITGQLHDTIDGYPSNTKVENKTDIMDGKSDWLDRYYMRIFRNFGLDYGVMSHNERLAAVTDMPAVAEAQNMKAQNEAGEEIIVTDPGYSLAPGGADMKSAAQYAPSRQNKTTAATTGEDIKEKILKYAPGVAAGVGIFKLFFK